VVAVAPTALSCWLQQKSTTVWPGFEQHYLLVGGCATPLNNMSSSVGMIIPDIWKNIKMFQTTNQSGYVIEKCDLEMLLNHVA
jgi:hypothetical protein